MQILNGFVQLMSLERISWIMRQLRFKDLDRLLNRMCLVGHGTVKTIRSFSRVTAKVKRPRIVLVVACLVKLDSERVLIDANDPSNIGARDIDSELGIVALTNNRNGRIYFRLEIGHLVSSISG